MKKGLAVAMAALLGVATMGTTAMAAAFRRYYNLLQRRTDPVQEVHSLNCLELKKKTADGNKVDIYNRRQQRSQTAHPLC